MTSGEPESAPDAGAFAPPAKEIRAVGKKPARPDFAARDELLRKIQAKIHEFNESAKRKMSDLEGLQNVGKANTRLEGMKRALANAVHKRTQIEKLRSMTHERLRSLENPAAVKARAARSPDLQLSADDVESRMEQLKSKLRTEQDADEYDKIVSRIQALHASYVRLVSDEGGASSVKAENLQASLSTEIDSYDAQLEELRQREGELREKLGTMIEQREESAPFIARLEQEHRQCLDVARQLRDKMNDINEDYNLQFQEYKQQMAQWTADMDAMRAQRRAEREAEQRQKEAERARRNLEKHGPPFSNELMRCEQVLKWCQQFENERDGGKVEEAKSSVAARPTQFEGMVAVSKKNGSEEADVFDALTPGKGGKRKVKGKAPRSGSEGRAPQQRLQLDFELLNLVRQLRLPVPQTLADIPGFVEDVRKKKAHFEDKQQRSLAGEQVEDEEEEAAAMDGAAPSASAAADARSYEPGEVSVTVRCDEAFGSVLVELHAH